MSKSIEQSIKEQLYILERLKFVQSHFPDAQVQENYIPSTFKSKMVGLQCTDIEFLNFPNEIDIVPYHKLIFKYNDQEEIIKVNSIPTKSKLAYIDWFREEADGKLVVKGIIRFSKLAFNLKASKFNDIMMNDCRVHILQFIKENSDYKLDDSNLEDRLKKLLIFT